MKIKILKEQQPTAQPQPTPTKAAAQPPAAPVAKPVAKPAAKPAAAPASNPKTEAANIVKYLTLILLDGIQKALESAAKTQAPVVAAPAAPTTVPEA
jgi:hypothetical protein